MIRSPRTKIAATLVTAGALLLAGPTLAHASTSDDGNVPAPLTEEQMAEHPDAEWFAASSSTGEVFGSADGPELIPEPVPAPEEGEVGTNLIDGPFAYNACFINYDSEYELASYTYYSNDGPQIVRLQCGYHNDYNDVGYGWHHIQVDHQSQWQARIDAVGGGGSWDDFMSYAVDTVVGWPMVDVPKGSNDTRCLSAPILMYDAQGTYEYTFNPTIFITTNADRVITAYPSTSAGC